jgi:hypothetical protein
MWAKEAAESAGNAAALQINTLHSTVCIGVVRVRSYFKKGSSFQ